MWCRGWWSCHSCSAHFPNWSYLHFIMACIVQPDGEIHRLAFMRRVDHPPPVIKATGGQIWNFHNLAATSHSFIGRERRPWVSLIFFLFFSVTSFYFVFVFVFVFFFNLPISASFYVICRLICFNSIHISADPSDLREGRSERARARVCVCFLFVFATLYLVKMWRVDHSIKTVDWIWKVLNKPNFTFTQTDLRSLIKEKYWINNIKKYQKTIANQNTDPSITTYSAIYYSISNQLFLSWARLCDLRRFVSSRHEIK